MRMELHIFDAAKLTGSQAPNSTRWNFINLKMLRSAVPDLSPIKNE